MDWQEISGSWVLVPPQPMGVIHFLGGAFVASAPQLTYRWLLEQLGSSGFVVIATPFVNTLDHVAIARSVLNRFESIFALLQARNIIVERYLPVYGMGHSMGCKLHLLIGSLFRVERAGNIFISYNNYPVRRAIPFMEQLEVDRAFNLEFTPSPTETNELIAQTYPIQRNLLLKFNNDDIDQTLDLHSVLRSRFEHMTALVKLSGNHLTPLNQDVPWQAGEVFSPIDAVAQWVKQGLSRDLYRLKLEILRWLNPVRVV